MKAIINISANQNRKGKLRVYLCLGDAENKEKIEKILREAISKVDRLSNHKISYEMWVADNYEDRASI